MLEPYDDEVDVRSGREPAGAAERVGPESAQCLWVALPTGAAGRRHRRGPGQGDCPESEALHEPLDSLRLSPGQTALVDDESVHACPPGTQGEAIGEGSHVVPIHPDDPELSRRSRMLGAEIDARRGGSS